MKKPIYILGINESHVASAALLRDGQIIACASEERFTRKKGQWGYPVRSIDYCLKEAGISPNEVDTVVFGFKNLSLFIHGNPSQKISKFSIGIIRLTRRMRSIVMVLIGAFPPLFSVYDFLYKTVYAWFLWFFFCYLSFFPAHMR